MSSSSGNSASLSAQTQAQLRAKNQDSVKSSSLDMMLPLSSAGITPSTDYSSILSQQPDFPQISVDGSASSLNRNASIISRGSHASGLELGIAKTHRRNRSDASCVSVMSYSGSEVVAADGNSEDPILLVEAPPKNLLCMVCEKVFTDPVIAKCGVSAVFFALLTMQHTFCRLCVLNMPPGDCCPVHKIQLSKNNIISNLAVNEQINELTIRCKYGCRSIPNTVGQFELDPNGCSRSIKLLERKLHENTCEFAPVRCPNSSACGLVRKKDLDAHLRACERVPCAHRSRGCKFAGTRAAAEEHTRECRFESIKGLLAENDQRIEKMTQALDSKEQEIGFLRSMLAKLSERVERMESLFEMRIDCLDDNFTRLSADGRETSRSVQEIQREVSTIQAKLGLVDDYDILGATHMFKCKGTFVGHQGPVWALAVHGDLLFSGSSDETIKVWDTSTSFKCKKTLNSHRGIVHALCVHNGSSDCVINVWDIDSLQLVTTLEGHDNPVCTLAVANGMLLSGSLKVVKIWDTHTNKCIGQLTGLNHWVRALVANEQHIYAGSYQTISIWSSQRAELELTDRQQPKKLHVLHTSTQGGSVYSLCVTDKVVICGTYENLIHVWDLGSFTEIHVLDGHVGTVYALAVMTQGNGKGRLFSASYDRTIKVWSLDLFQCVQTLTRHQNSVDTLVVQRGRLFSGAADSSVKVWQ